MFRKLLIILPFLCLFSSILASAQPVKIAVKFKQGTTENILNDFANNNLRNSRNPLLKSIEKYDVFKSGQLFSEYVSRLNLKSNPDLGLDRIFILESNSQKVNELVSEIKYSKYVEYVKEISTLKLESFTPDDIYYSSQYYLNFANIPPVWDSRKGGVLVGIIDSGIDFLHPDLQNSYYINPGEYGNGKENNGIDDDNDGFIDNWRGWNFIKNSNDIEDDNIYSHGTGVAGIISAGFNNGIGISSVTAGSKSLILKCFNSQGIGYEDHIASAILYSVMQGVKVLNMSFGDYIYSDLMRDVIRYAYSKNVVLISSAGNDNSSVLHYPASFDEVISVAASDRNSQKASFSAYGVTVDIYAPGVDILTTSRLSNGDPAYENNYMLSNGTSFSAPIVAGIASLLLAENPSLSNEDLRGILVSTTNYFANQSNWDDYYSSGMLNSLAAFQNFRNPSTARIYSPSVNFSFTNDSVKVAITAASVFFSSYSLKYGTGLKPDSYVDLFTSSLQVINDTVYIWNTSSLPDTSYTLKLRILTNTGRIIEHSSVIYKTSSPPAFVNYSNGEIVSEGGFAEFLTFTTDVPAKGSVFYRRKGSNDAYKGIYADEGNIGYFTNDHFVRIQHSNLIPDLNYEYYFEAVSQNGLVSMLSDSSFYFKSKKQIDKYSFVKKSYNLPKSQVCDKVVDISNNGTKDILANNVNRSLGSEIYEFSNGRFLSFAPDWIGQYIIRDIILRNDKWNLLVSSRTRNGVIYQSQSAFALPDAEIWSSGTAQTFWSSCFADVDGDGIEEVLGFTDNGLSIKKFTGTVSDFASINFNPQNGTGYANSQNTLVYDFDSDGKKEVVFTNSFFDSEGQKTSVNIYEYTSANNFILVFHEEYPLLIKGDNLTMGDYDGDGSKEIAIGLSTDFNIPVKLYSVLFLKSIGNNNFTEYSSVEFYNNNPQAELSSESGDIDNDAKDELIISEGNSLYVVKYNSLTGKFEPLFYSEGINSYNSIVYDFDGNGIKEIGINNNDSLIFLEKNIAFTGPSTPSGFKAFSVDSNSASLSFQSVPGAQYYKIYRSNSDSTAYSFLDSTYSTLYYDNGVSNRRDYYYKVSAEDTSKPVQESILSSSVKVFIHNKSKLISAVYDKGNLFLKFSEKIPVIIPNPDCFLLNGSLIPNSVAVKNNYEYSISFKDKIPNGINSIASKGLFDFYSSPVDTNAVTFSVQNIDSASFYITSLKLVNNELLSVEFNFSVDTVSAYNLSNYSVEPFNLKVISAARDKDNKKLLYLGINSKGNIGASGKTYFIRINNLVSENGSRIVSGSGSMFSLSFVREDLSGIAVYPNPFSFSKASKQVITFANLTKTAKVYVYSLTGVLVAELNETDGNGGVEWDLRDSKGNLVPSGIYIYKVEGKNSQGVEVESNMNKFAVVK